MDLVADQIVPALAEIPPEIAGLGDRVFLSYQREATALSHEVDLLVIEKSRRIGITWAFAGDDAVTAATIRSAGGDDVLYISYSFDMAREYIDAAASFARTFMGIAAVVGETLFSDQTAPDANGVSETRQIKAFRINFASGHTIQALTSAPRSLRGKQGRVRIDEAAFVDHLPELLDAALALLIWGGQVTVMSTHFGADNEFNQLIHRIRAGEQEGRVLRITFADAVDAGLYDRVCLRKGETPTEAGQAAWVAKIRAIYGAGAAQELDVIPSKGGGAWLSYDLVERAERDGVALLRWELEDAFGTKNDEVRKATALLWCEERLAPVLAALDPRAAYGVGGDFARRGDLTDIVVLREEQDRTWSTALVIELRNMPFTEQIFILSFMLTRLRRWSAQMDAGGLGMAIVERMQQLFGELRVVAVAMREAWWLVEAPPIKSRFEDGRITVPRDRDTSADLRGLQVKGGVPFVPEKRARAKGDDSEGAKGGQRHYDFGVSLVLACAALRAGASEPFTGAASGDRPPAFPGAAEHLRVTNAGWGAAVQVDSGPDW